MKFVWAFMPKPEGDADKAKEKPTGGVQAPEAVPGRVKLSEIGADLKVYIEAFEKLDPKEKEEFLKKAQQWDQNGNIDEIRRAGITAAENEKDPNKKHEMLSAIFLERDKKANTKMSFRVDFKGNDLAERKVGAGDLLPISAKAIRVQYADGRVIERAIRTINPTTGRIGYYEATALQQGIYQYVPVFTGTTIDVLESQPGDSLEVKRRMFAENMEIYNPPQRSAPVSYSGGVASGFGAVPGPRSVPSNSQQKSGSPRFEMSAPISGYTKIEGKSYEAVDRNFWSRNVDIAYHEKFMGVEIAGGVSRFILPYLREAEARMRAAGITYNFRDVQCHNDRDVRGVPGLKSYHAYGVALDINPGDNAFKQSWDSLNPEKRVPMEVVQIMESLGFRWGGRWTGRPDPMHFEFAINPITSQALLTDPEAKQLAAQVLPKQAPGGVPRPVEGVQGSPKLAQSADKATERWLPLIKASCERNGIPQYVNLVRAFMYRESGGKPDAVGRNTNGTFDQGLMQLNSAYFKDPNVMDPATNIELGVKAIAKLLKRYGGNIENVIMAYNCGHAPSEGSIPASTRNVYLPRVLATYGSLESSNPDTGGTGGNSAVA